MSSIRVGVVEKVNLKDNDVNKLYSITVITTKSMNRGEVCYPIDANLNECPNLPSNNTSPRNGCNGLTESGSVNPFP